MVALSGGKASRHLIWPRVDSGKTTLIRSAPSPMSYATHRFHMFRLWQRSMTRFTTLDLSRFGGIGLESISLRWQMSLPRKGAPRHLGGDI